MTQIYITKQPESLRVCLTAKGHAGSAKSGEDTVCAAISALTYGYAKEISLMDDKLLQGRVIKADENNPADLTVDVICESERAYRRVLYNLAPIERALEALATDHREHVELYYRK